MCDVNGTACDAIVFSDDMSTTVDQVILFNNLYNIITLTWKALFHAWIQRGWVGGQGVRTSIAKEPYSFVIFQGLENHKAIGFLSNTAPDHLENHKATKPASNVGPLLARQ